MVYIGRPRISIESKHIIHMCIPRHIAQFITALFVVRCEDTSRSGRQNHSLVGSFIVSDAQQLRVAGGAPRDNNNVTRVIDLVNSLRIRG